MKEADKQLYKMFFHGESSAVSEVVTRFRNELTLFVNCYLHDINQAEDIVSDTFVRVILKKPKLKNENHFKTYIYTIAKNLSVDYIRKKRQEVSFCENYHGAIIDEIVVTQEKTELCEAISKLKDEYRLIIYLKYYDNFSTDEIAKIVKKNKKYVYNVVERAKKQLKNLLGGEENIWKI